MLSLLRSFRFHATFEKYSEYPIKQKKILSNPYVLVPPPGAQLLNLEPIDFMPE